MLFPDAVVQELAQTWIRLHGRAARRHLQSMIERLEITGDVEGIANYRRILASLENGSAMAG